MFVMNVLIHSSLTLLKDNVYVDHLEHSTRMVTVCIVWPLVVPCVKLEPIDSINVQHVWTAQQLSPMGSAFAHHPNTLWMGTANNVPEPSQTINADYVSFPTAYAVPTQQSVMNASTSDTLTLLTDNVHALPLVHSMQMGTV
jgi:hypothetical protein